MSIGGRLQVIRKVEQKTQPEFANSLGISESAYKNYERNVTDIPVNLAINICQKFTIPMEWLLLGEGEMNAVDVNQKVEDAVVAMRRFAVDNDLQIPPEKEGTLVRFLFEEMVYGKDYGQESMQRFFRTLKQ